MIQAAEFELGETHGILRRPEHRIRATSRGLGWSALYASVQDEHPYEDRFEAIDDHLLIFHLTGPVAVSRSLGRMENRCVVRPGSLCLTPGGWDFRVRLEAELATLHVYLRRTLLEHAAEENELRGPVELLPRHGEHDPVLERLALGVRDLLDQDDDASRMRVDDISHAMATHLLRKHAAMRPHRIETGRGVLSRAMLARLDEFIEANLESSLSLQDLATVSGLSPSHFARRFKATTGLPPHQYLIAMRVRRAMRLLAAPGQQIAEIAYDCGFTHQEHMSRVFRRDTGMTPASFRRAALS